MEKEVFFPDRCTCDKGEYTPHPCPFAQEIDGDDTECTCCPYCEQLCADAI